jgi:hypothetical protein
MFATVPLRICLLTAFAFGLASAHAQQVVKQGKPVPAAINPAAFVLLDSVVTEQWPVAPAIVNLPSDITVINPGQCIRVAAASTGDRNQEMMQGATIAWTIRIGEKPESFSAAPIAASKQIKPEGLDFVTSALKASGIKSDAVSAFASGYTTLSASTAKWCVPQGATDQQAAIEVVVKRGDKETRLTPHTLQIESLDSAAKKPFKDPKDFSAFVMSYHKAPEPGRLITAFQFLVAMNQKSLAPFAFFRYAFQHDAATVQGLGPQLAASPRVAEMLALNLVTKAGVQLAEPPTLTDDDKKVIAESPDIPDPFDMQPTPDLPSKLDYLWMDFTATGRIAPIKAIASALAWRSDYEAFDKARQAGEKMTTATDSIIRAVTYMAAGWSLASFQHSDPLAADYIEAIMADPTTPPAIKQQLTQLQTETAFKKH